MQDNLKTLHILHQYTYTVQQIPTFTLYIKKSGKKHFPITPKTKNTMQNLEIINMVLTDDSLEDAENMLLHFYQKGFVPLLTVTEGDEFDKIKNKLLQENEAQLQCIARFVKYGEVYYA